MNMKNMLVLGMSIVFFHAPGAHAGAESHGGNVVSCKGLPTVTLDYYNATLNTLGGAKPNLVDISSFTSQQVIDLAIKQLGDYQKIISDLNIALKQIGPMSSWTSADLTQMNDSLEPYILPPGCTRKTGAIRQDPLQMYGDPNVISALSDAQQGLLLLHEALYLIANRNGLTNSVAVRNLIKVILTVSPPDESLSLMIGGLGESTNKHLHIGFNGVGDGIFSGLYSYQLWTGKVDKQSRTITLNKNVACSQQTDAQKVELACMPSFEIDCSHSAWTELHIEDAATIYGTDYTQSAEQCSLHFVVNQGPYIDGRWDAYITGDGGAIFLKDNRGISNSIFFPW